MTTFTYIAINENGNEISGELEANSMELASEIISSRGHIPESVKEKSGTTAGSSYLLNKLNQNLTPVKPRDIILFTKQFKTLIQAGVSMIQILSIMEAQTENKKLKNIITRISEDIKEGASLSIAFQKHEKIFSPQFIAIFERANIELPLPTKICMVMYNILHHYGLFLLIGVIVSIIAFVKVVQTEKGKYILDRSLMKLPLVGHLIVKSAMSRFASIFSILQPSGVTVLESMEILSDTIGNAAITREFTKIKELLTEGRGISQPLRQAKYFTPMVINKKQPFHKILTAINQVKQFPV